MDVFDGKRSRRKDPDKSDGISEYENEIANVTSANNPSENWMAN
jgi:hypothetical protein